MGYGAAVGLNGIATTLDNLTGTIKWAVDRQDRKDREVKEDQLRDLQMEQLRTTHEAARLGLEKTKKDLLDKEEATELSAAWQSGDLTQLRPELAQKIVKDLESKGITADYVVRRAGAAKALNPIIGKLAQQSDQWRSQPGGPDQEYLPLSSDPNFTAIKPYLKDLLFGKERFNAGDGSPKVHYKEIGGRRVPYVVNQDDPVRDVMYHAPSGKVIVPLNLRAVAVDEKGQPVKKDGALVYDDTLQIPGGIATVEQGNNPDETISALSLPELQAKVNELSQAGDMAIQLQRKAIEAEYLKRSPEAQSSFAKVLSEQITGDMKADRLHQKLSKLKTAKAYQDAAAGLYGSAIKVAEELATQGLISVDELGKSVAAVTLKGVEHTQKTAEDETNAQAILVGYANMADLPRTAALAKDLMGKKVRAKQAVEILKSVAAGEQRQQDNQAKIEQARAGRPAAPKTFSKIEEIEYLVKQGMPREKATATVYGVSKQSEALTAKYYSVLAKQNDNVLDPSQRKSDEELMALAEQMARREEQQTQQAAPAAPNQFEQSLILNNGQPVGVQGGLTPAGPRRSATPHTSRTKADQFYK